MKFQQSFLRLHFTEKPELLVVTWGKTLYEKQQALVKGTSVPRENKTPSLSPVTVGFFASLLTAPRENFLDPGRARREGFAFQIGRQFYPLDDLKLIL